MSKEELQKEIWFLPLALLWCSKLDFSLLFLLNFNTQHKKSSETHSSVSLGFFRLFFYSPFFSGKLEVESGIIKPSVDSHQQLANSRQQIAISKSIATNRPRQRWVVQQLLKSNGFRNPTHLEDLLDFLFVVYRNQNYKL